MPYDCDFYGLITDAYLYYPDLCGLDCNDITIFLSNEGRYIYMHEKFENHNALGKSKQSP